MYKQQSMYEKLDKFFGISEAGSNLRKEIVAGFTTFLAMAYIIFVNPQILSNAAGKEAIPTITLATTLGAAIATFIMAFYANKPFALAPGMGLNAYFTYVVVRQYGIPFQAALGIVVAEGIIFVILTLTKVRTAIVNAIPLSMKNSIAAGIGLFLTLIGMENAGIVIRNPDTLVSLGHIFQPTTLMAVIGFFVAAILITLRVPGALLISIIGITVVSIASGYSSPPNAIVALPQWNIKYTVFSANFSYLVSLSAAVAIFTMFMVDFFDTLGTVTGLSAKAGILTKDGKVPDIEKMLMADAIGTVEGGLLGTSTVTTYIESATGVEEGGRTGLTAAIVASLFVISTVFWPVVVAIPSYATAPALMIVGLLMMSTLGNINFRKMDEAIPAFVTLVMMPFTYNISNGIGAGIITYVIIKCLTGKWKEVHPIMYVLAVMFFFYFLAISGAISL